ncbi:MAG: membrane protein insertase YidC [Clostridia bacterium]|nr:membrane protein insertase YidC [Clostridia bacterium]
MDAILQFFGTILSFFSDITGGFYLFGLFLFALLVKLILVPFAIKQQKTSIKQAKMRPKEMAIRNKYKGRTDQKTQQKMQNEVMDLYQREGYNPMGGCLPLLIQMPVILILYNVIINPLKYICGWSKAQISTIATSIGLEKASEFANRDIELIQHLNAANEGTANAALAAAELAEVSFADIPNFAMGIFDLSATPGWNILIIVPILTFVFQFLSSKITRKFTYQPMSGDQQTNSTMKVMDIVLPAMTTWIAFTVPAAIGIYWMFNNILGVIQTIIIHKVMPLPTCTEEDIKAAEKELAGKAYKAKHPLPTDNLPPKKSLHYIDFEDEEVDADLGEYESIYDKTPEEREKAAEEKEEISEKQKKLFGKAEMKKDEPQKGKKD